MAFILIAANGFFVKIASKGAGCLNLYPACNRRIAVQAAFGAFGLPKNR